MGGYLGFFSTDSASSLAVAALSCVVDDADNADVKEEEENPVAKNDDVSRLLLLVATATARRIARIWRDRKN